jgi:uncharacterized membrane protein
MVASQHIAITRESKSPSWNCHLARGTGLIDVFGDKRVRRLSDTRVHAISIAIALLISLYNWYTRFEHGSSAVVPTGLVLSIIVVLVLLVAGWKGGEMVFRHSVGVAD